ncbi:MAG: YpbF family protein [Bacillus sp. (in: Bacteria)]|nr:YpbF family protein [Bacillus sp. (in: firmicutes)]
MEMGQSNESGIREYHEVIIEALIEAKQKEEKAEKTMMKWGLLFLAVLIGGIIYIAIKLMSIEVSSYLSLLLSDMIIVFWIAALFFLLLFL